MKRNLPPLLCFWLCAGCAGGKVTQRHESAGPPRAKRDAIYVSDFTVPPTGPPATATNTIQGATQTNPGSVSTNTA